MSDRPVVGHHYQQREDARSKRGLSPGEKLTYVGSADGGWIKDEPQPIFYRFNRLPSYLEEISKL